MQLNHVQVKTVGGRKQRHGQNYFSGMRIRWRTFWYDSPRRAISVVTLLGYLASAIGFPMPADSASANPCGQRVCCCGSEAQCRATGCGCSDSPLPPPAKSPAPTPPPANCCSQETHRTEDCPPEGCESSSPTAEPSIPSRSCCVKPRSKLKKPSDPTTKSPGKTQSQELRWVVGIAALKCQGGPTHWFKPRMSQCPARAPTVWQPSWPYCESIPVMHVYPFVVVVDLLNPPPTGVAGLSD